MGKRSDGQFERVERDFYPSPYEVVLPLLPHLPKGANFIEPCAGDGRLVRHLEKHGHKCVYACDIEPQSEGIEKRDILFFKQNWQKTDYFITNPPWGRETLHPMILTLIDHAPAWLLFDADWMHTVQAAPYLPFCQKIVAIGRVKWIEDTENGGMDNACWYLFDKYASGIVRFYGR
jgi:hypothetical protein